MNNQIGFISENISAISSQEQKDQHHQSKNLRQSNSDTDRLVQEILKNRNVKKQLDQNSKDQLDRISSNIKQQQQILAIKQIDPSSKLRIRQKSEISVKQFKHDIQINLPQTQNQHPAHSVKQNLSNKQQKKLSLLIEKQMQKDKIQTLQNQTSQQENSYHTVENHQNMQLDQLITPQIQHLPQNQYNDNTLQQKQEDKEIQDEKSNHMISNMQSQISNKSSQVHKTINRLNDIQRDIQNLQSNIEVKNSMIDVPNDNYIREVENKLYFDFKPTMQQKETDKDIVNAITQHLNTIDKITKEESSVKRIQQRPSLKSNGSLGTEKKPTLEQPKDNFLEEFQTNYSENCRDYRIVQHRYESNHQFQIGQMKELKYLMDATDTNIQCKIMRAQIKNFQMKNRREKISLRSASYTKKYNFHSPIPKNNNYKIQFSTKFKISQALAGDYFQAKKNISKEKQLHLTLDEEYQILSDYYEMMKSKKVKSYEETLKQYEYNSKLEKYETVRDGFFKKTMSGLKKTSTQYQFNKSKKTIQFQDSQLPYYQLLKYKIDINKDMILQYEVFNLGKIKNLKDENIILKKQLQMLNEQIKQFDKTYGKQLGLKTGKSISKSYFKSPVTVKSIKPMINTLSKSPNIPRPQLALGSPKKISINNIQKSPNKLKLSKSFNKLQDRHNLLIDSVQLDYSRQKALVALTKHNDYGIETIIQQSKFVQQAPIISHRPAKKLSLSSSKTSFRQKSKNLVRNAVPQIRTELNLKAKSKSKVQILSKHTSPKKSIASIEYYNSLQN